MMTNDRVLVAGAGPVGLTCALLLARAGIPVTVLEAGPKLATESRASTFHPPTLDMLDALGAAKNLIAQGLIAPVLQYRTRNELLAAFDFSVLADVTSHPYRLQAEQFKLTAILADLLAEIPGTELIFDAGVKEVIQDDGSVTAITTDGRRFTGRWLVGADGASSAVRHALNIAFEGFTWSERFLVVSTPYDFMSQIPDLSSVSYVADPQRWHFYLQIPGLWRMMFPVPAEIDDTIAGGRAYAQAQMATLIDGVSDYEIVHTTLYRVHQRTALTYRGGRALLAGDAAHVNNPLGGMGMNGGIHDAVSLAKHLATVWHGGDERALDIYCHARRTVNLEYVQAQTIRNKQNLEARDPEAHADFRARMKAAHADPARARAFVMSAAMIDSLRREAELSSLSGG